MNIFQVVFELLWLPSIYRQWLSFLEIIMTEFTVCFFSFSIISSNQSCSVSSPLVWKIVFLRWCCSCSVDLNAFRLQTNGFLPALLHAQLISDVTCRWLVDSWSVFSPPHCDQASANWWSVHQRECRKWKETDWKQALCCCCLFKMSHTTSSYI